MSPNEPPRTAWRLPDPRDWPAGVDVGAIGGRIDAGTLLAGYRRGLFPMHAGSRLHWFSPDPRGVIEPAEFHCSRSLRRSIKGFETRIDCAFAAVVAGCADPQRPSGWIGPDYQRAYAELHRLGWAHSVETWVDGDLVGGLFGISLGSVFVAESKFHRVRDASKAAVASLADLLRDCGPTSLIDVQWSTDHLASLGAVEVPRPSYLDRLAIGRTRPGPDWRRLRWGD